MAEKLTLDEAVKLVEGDTAQLSNEQLAQINETFAQSFYNQEQHNQKTQDASDMALAESEARIQALSGQDSYNPADLESILSLANSISGFSSQADAAKAVAEKAAQQKADIEGAAPEEFVVETETLNDNEEYEIGTDDSKAESNEENLEDQTPSVTQEEDSHEEDAPVDVNEEENESQPTSDENVADAVENDDVPSQTDDELTFPDEKPAEEMTAQEFAAMMDPMSEQMPEMDSKEKLRQSERLPQVMELDEAAEYKPEYPLDNSEEYAKGEESIGQTLDFVVKQSAVRRLTVSKEEITPENLAAAREAEGERITMEYFNAVFGVCKSEEDLDKETPQQHAERLGKVADLISQKRPKEEIYAAMGITPTKEQEQFAANAVYATNAEPAKNWAKSLGKSGLKFMDKYRDFEKNNPQVAMGLGLVMAGNPIYMGARMALSARGLYKDYENFKEKHPDQKASFINMMKDKETRKSLMANAGIFIRSVPVVGQAYGAYGMAKQLKNTCKKGFWQDLGSKIKDAGNSLKAVAKDPKDKSKWKDAWNKVGKPVTIVGGVALAAYGAYRMVDAHTAVPEQEDNKPENVPTQDNNHLDMSQERMAEVMEKMGVNPEVVAGMSPEAMERHIMTHQEEYQSVLMGEQDKDFDGIKDSQDIDHGEGWAVANETQIDRAFDADPRGINEILNDGKWHSSAELHKMMENGEFSDDQLKAIHAHAAETFDKDGHITDSELKAYYEDLAKQQAQEQTKEQTPEEYVQEVGARAAEVSTEAMTHDVLSASGLIPGENLADLEGLIAGAKQSGDFSQVDSFMAANGIDPNSEAGKGVQDYINAAKGLSATGGEIPDENFFNYGKENQAPEQQQEVPVQDIPNNRLPEAEQMHDLAEKMQARANETNSSAALGQVLREEVQAGNLTPEQAGKISQVLSETVEAHNGDYNSALKDFERQTAQDVKAEREAAAQLNEGESKPINLNETVNFGREHGADNDGLTADEGMTVTATLPGGDRLVVTDKPGEHTFTITPKEEQTEQPLQMHAPEENVKNIDPVYYKPEEQLMTTEKPVENVKNIDPVYYKPEEQLMTTEKPVENIKNIDPVYYQPEHSEQVTEPKSEENTPEQKVEEKDSSVMTKEQEEAQLKQVAMHRASIQARRMGLAPETPAYEKFMADKEANYDASRRLSDNIKSQVEASREASQTQVIENKIKEMGLEGKEADAFREYTSKQGTENAEESKSSESTQTSNTSEKETAKEEDKTKPENVVSNEEIAKNIQNRVSKAEAMFEKESLTNEGASQKWTREDGSVQGEYATNYSFKSVVYNEATGVGIISAHTAEGDGYKIRMTPDGLTTTEITDKYGEKTVEVRDASNKVVERHVEEKTYEEKMTFRTEKLDLLQKEGILSAKEVDEKMAESRQELSTEKTKELRGIGNEPTPKPVKQTTIDLSRVGPQKSNAG